MQQRKRVAQRNESWLNEQVALAAVRRFIPLVKPTKSIFISNLFEAAIAGDNLALEQLESWDPTKDPWFPEEVDEFRLQYQLYYMIKTFPCYPGLPKEERAFRAIKKFDESEEACRMINFKLQYGTKAFRILEARLETIQSIVADVLGRAPDVVDGRFGPGATRTVSKRDSHPLLKASRRDITRDAIPEFENSISYTSFEANIQPYSILDGCKLQLVPKTSFIDRVIAVEPTLNSWLQCGIGDEIVDRLRSVELYIKPYKGKLSTDIHGELAKTASKTGELSTIDLSSASDRWSSKMVRLLLAKSDPRWIALLESTRSPRYELDGEVKTLHKFMTMGNGFTFPLQTLLFYAVCRSVTTGKVSVYGDDIIIPTRDVDLTISLLTEIGHKVNVDKSFSFGYFRESCGHDYFNGVETKKFKLKPIEGTPHELYTIRLCNAIYRISGADGALPSDRRYGYVHQYIRSKSEFRSFTRCCNVNGRRLPPAVPVAAGDGGFHADPIYLQEFASRRDFCETYKVITYKGIVKEWHGLDPEHSVGLFSGAASKRSTDNKARFGTTRYYSGT